MANVRANSTYELVTVCRARNQNGLTVSHWHTGDIVGTISEDEAATFLLDLAGSLMRECMSSESLFRGGTLKRLGPDAPGDAVVSVGGAGPGLSDDFMIATQTAGLISLRTGIAGRANRGRKYIPFPSELDNEEGGKPRPEYIANASALGAFFSTAQNFDVLGDQVYFSPVVYNRLTGTFQFLNSYIVRPEWATQRRRSQINRGDGLPTP